MGGLLKVLGLSKKSRKRVRKGFLSTSSKTFRGGEKLVSTGFNYGTKAIDLGFKGTEMAFNRADSLAKTFSNPLVMMGLLVVGGIVAVKVL